MELSRRDLFKMSVLGSAAIGLPVERSVSGLSLGSSSIAGSALPAPFTTPFSRPVTIFPFFSDATFAGSLLKRRSQRCGERS
jgi:spore coat protein A, manganese oxidase